MATIVKSGLMRMNAERDQRSDRIADRIRPAHAAESDSGNQHRRNQRTEKRSQAGSEIMRGNRSTLMFRRQRGKHGSHRNESGNSQSKNNKKIIYKKKQGRSFELMEGID